MKKEILSLSKHTIIYGIGTVISSSVSFIMLPLYTRCLTPADYGVIELVTMTLDIITMIAGMGITSTIFKYYSDYDNITEKNKVMSTAFIMLFWITLITAGIGVLISMNLSQLVFGDQGNTFYFQTMFVTYFVQSLNIIPFAMMRANQNSIYVVIVSLIKLALQVSLNILFLVRMEMGILGIMLSSLLTSLLINSYLCFDMLRRINLTFSWPMSKKMIRFGYPFIFASLSSFVLTYSNRYFLNAAATLTIVGIYSLASKFGFLLGNMVVWPFMQIWQTQRYEIAKQDNGAKVFGKIFFYFNSVIIAISLLISLYVKDIISIMSDKSFLEAYKLVPIIISAYVFQSWTFFCNIGIYLKEDSKYEGLSYFIAAVFNTILNFLLIPEYGAYGAAWATVGAFFLRFVLINFYSQRSYYIEYGWWKQAQLFAFAVIIYLAGLAFDVQFLGLSLLKNSVLMLTFMISAYLIFLDEGEKNFIMQIMRKPITAASFGR